jgi:O-antigen/teichoic acid export membrane protein
MALYLLRRSLTRPEVRFSRDEVVYSRYTVVGEVARVLIYTANLYIIRIFLGPHEVGIFAAGSRLTTMVELLVLSSLSVPLLYYFSHPESANMRAGIVKRGTRVIGTAMGFASLMLAILAEPIVNLFLGDAYREGAAVARVYASHSLGVSLLVLFIPLYLSVNKPQYTVTQGLLTFLLNLILSLVLIPRYGAVGAAAAGVAAITATVLGATFFIKHRFSLDLRGSVVRIFLLYAGCYTLAETGYPLAGALLYLTAIWPLRLLRQEDVGMLKRGDRS